MCCDTTKCGAENEICRLRFRDARSVAARCQRKSTTRGIKSVRRDVAAFMTLAQLRQPTQLQVKPVRQCAQRGVVGPERDAGFTSIQ